MDLNNAASAAVGLIALLLGIMALVRQPKALLGWIFLLGMGALVAESLSLAVGIQSDTAERAAKWWGWSHFTQSVVPGIWLAFSLTYGRGNYREFLRRWRLVIAFFLLVPPLLSFTSPPSIQLPGGLEISSSQSVWLRLQEIPSEAISSLLLILLLIGNVLTLSNFEKTFRASVGTVRWRVKFVILGLSLLFGARVFTQSQALLFSGYDASMPAIHAIALMITCSLVTVGYARAGFSQFDIYPSRTLLQNSAAVVLVGAYLLVVGVLAQLVGYLGGVESFRSQAFIALIGISGLGVLLCSDRARLHLQRFVSRHLRRPEYDFRLIWSQFTERTSSVLDPIELSTITARLISETFHSLSVNVFLVDQQNNGLIAAGSTSPSPPDKVRQNSFNQEADLNALVKALQEKKHFPFDLDKNLDTKLPENCWAELLRKATPIQFEHGGNRICAPIVADERLLGVIVLADRVNGLRYTQEELELLKCLSNQIAAALQNSQLSKELLGAKQMEAFQTMSAFFVHDMKNLASRLNLMLQNLPDHFDDPEFRKDALRSIAGTTERIKQLIARLSTLRKSVAIHAEATDLNQLIRETLEPLEAGNELRISTQLNPIPDVSVDREQIASVVTNLVLNARDAVDGNPDSNRMHVNIKTAPFHVNADGVNSVAISVEDNGTGMSAEFIQNSLFLPFKSTKQNGLGIGMFQAKATIEAHRGSLQVKSIPDEGTTMRIILPVAHFETTVGRNRIPSAEPGAV